VIEAESGDRGEEGREHGERDMTEMHARTLETQPGSHQASFAGQGPFGDQPNPGDRPNARKSARTTPVSLART